jgi:hypothetical protein
MIEKDNIWRIIIEQRNSIEKKSVAYPIEIEEKV